MLHLASIYPHCWGSFTAGAVSVTCLFKTGHWIFIVSNTHTVCVITEQNSLRHKLSHRATFTFLKTTGLCIKFCLNPCTHHRPYEQAPALFSRALQPQAKLRSTAVTHLPISHTACCFQACPSLYLDLTWYLQGPKTMHQKRESLPDLPATVGCASNTNWRTSPTSVLNWRRLQQEVTGLSSGEL